jgi:Tol biopolymer transport system component
VILSTPPQLSRLGVGWLAYVHDGDIYMADSTGAGSRRIVHSDGVTFLDVTWSPDGTRLAAEADSGTILIDPVTGAAAFVGGTAPAWSPDGRQLAVVDSLPVGSRLRLVDVATLAAVRTYPFAVRAGLAWSPNGRWIAASGACSGSSCPPDSNGEATALIRIDVATGEVVQLDLPSGRYGFSREPAWSPDSSQIAFVRWGTGCGGFDGCGTDVFVADADGSNVRDLNHVLGDADQPGWSPDGSWISWRAIDANGTRRTAATSHGITLEHPDGTGERLIAGAGTIGYSWGPESDRVWLAVQAAGASTAILWEAPLVDPPAAVDVSLDPPPEYGSTGLPFAWQGLAKGRTAAVLPSAPVATAAADLAQVTPAPAPAANPGKRWPTLRTVDQNSCSIGSISVGSPNVTTIASFCDASTTDWSGAWSPTGSAFALVQGGMLTMFGADGHENRVTDDLDPIDGVSWSPDGGWISVTAGPSAYVLRPDGSDRRQVPGAPSWSPDGRMMAITRPDGVLLVGATEGTNLVALGSNPGPTTWAPDGSRFAFIRDGNLWTVAIDGTDARNVTALPLGGASWAAWSPDGHWIAVSAFHGVWLVPSNGGEKTWLDFGRSSAISTVLWSPDSQRVAIETYPQTPNGQPSDLGQTAAIYLVRPGGPHTIRIDDAAGPNWSPDGRFLLVADQQSGGGDSGDAAIMNGDGTGRVDLPAIGLDPRSFVWAR